MMSSVIPARLQFQCGHTALVSLPRVKGESSAQRTDRIAREKSAAQVRSCDFCPAQVELEVVDVAQPVVVVEVQPAAPIAPVAPVAPVAVPVAPVVPVPMITDAPPTTTRRVAWPRRRTPAPVVHAAQNGRAINYRFLVRFRTEAVVEAIDIRDALRQAESLGAAEVLALTRS
jgi:hypothetical protein